MRSPRRSNSRRRHIASTVLGALPIHSQASSRLSASLTGGLYATWWVADAIERPASSYATKFMSAAATSWHTSLPVKLSMMIGSWNNQSDYGRAARRLQYTRDTWPAYRRHQESLSTSAAYEQQQQREPQEPLGTNPVRQISARMIQPCDLVGALGAVPVGLYGLTGVLGRSTPGRIRGAAVKRTRVSAPQFEPDRLTFYPLASTRSPVPMTGRTRRRGPTTLCRTTPN